MVNINPNTEHDKDIHIEQAKQTSIPLITIMDLILETTRTLPDIYFQNLTYFYITAQRKKILPQCTMTSQNTVQPNTPVSKEFAHYLATLTDHGIRCMMYKITRDEHTLFCAERNAANECCHEK